MALCWGCTLNLTLPMAYLATAGVPFMCRVQGYPHQIPASLGAPYPYRQKLKWVSGNAEGLGPICICVNSLRW